MNKIITIGVNTLRSFSGPVFNFLIIVFGISRFGKEYWGLLINAQLWVFVIVFILSWGHKDYLLRLYSETPSKIYNFFYSNFYSRSILIPLSLLFFLFFPTETAILCVVLTILMHCYDSLYTLIVYAQKFSHFLIADSLGFIIVICYIFLLKSFQLDSILLWYCISYFVKLIYMVITLKLWSQNVILKFSLNELKFTFPFFLLGLVGWLLSKIDIYIVDQYLPKSNLSEYQLLITSFIMLQALSSFFVLPFTKHIYRVSNIVLNKIRKKLYLIALPIIIIGTFCIWFIMENMVHLNLNYQHYIMGGIMCLPSFFYTLDIMQLIKIHDEKTIILINFIGVLTNIICVIMLIDAHKILGVLMGVSIAQWVVLILYKLQKRLNN